MFKQPHTGTPSLQKQCSNNGCNLSWKIREIKFLPLSLPRGRHPVPGSCLLFLCTIVSFPSFGPHLDTIFSSYSFLSRILDHALHIVLNGWFVFAIVSLVATSWCAPSHFAVNRCYCVHFHYFITTHITHIQAVRTNSAILILLLIVVVCMWCIFDTPYFWYPVFPRVVVALNVTLWVHLVVL
jgi:hypothetical protein